MYTTIQFTICFTLPFSTENKLEGNIKMNFRKYRVWTGSQWLGQWQALVNTVMTFYCSVKGTFFEWLGELSASHCS